MRNIVVYRAVNIIAQACASVDWNVYSVVGATLPQTNTSGELPIKPVGKKQRVKIDNHPLALLLARPNKDKARSTFIEQLISYLLITGTNYLFGSFNSNVYRPGMKPLGLYNLRPDLITLIGGDNGDVALYRYTTGNTHIDYPAWKIMPIRFFNPVDELEGLSPIQVAAEVIERQNAGEEWNFNLMRNMARPSGAFVAATEFSDEGRARLRREIFKKYGGGKLTAGMPMLLENGLQYIQLAINPVDADWHNSDASAGRKIASALGVDPLLMQDKQYSTYNNELEAKLAMWELTCFPLMEKLKDELNAFLVPFYGGNVEIDYDREPIESLKRNRQLESVTTIAEWNTGLRSFNDSAIDLDMQVVADKDDFYRFGPTMFVRRKDIGKFLDAQKLLWSQPPAPMQPQPGIPAAPVEPNSTHMVGDSGIPSTGNVRLNKVPYRQVPLLPAEKPFRSAEWHGEVKKGLIEFFNAELVLLLEACRKQRSLADVKAMALSVVSLHGTQLQEIMAGYYASVVGESGRYTSAQFGEKFLFNKQVIDVLGPYAGKNITEIVDGTLHDITEIFLLYEKLDDITWHLRELYKSYRESRAQQLAEQETAVAVNIGSYLAARQTGLPLYKTLVTVCDAHKNHQGQQRRLEEMYELAGDTLLFPVCACREEYTMSFAIEGLPLHRTVVEAVD